MRRAKGSAAELLSDGDAVERGRSLHLDLRAFKRRQISSKAKELCVDRGYDKTTVSAVARALGLSRAVIYTYFRTKAELFAADTAEYLGQPRPRR